MSFKDFLEKTKEITWLKKTTRYTTVSEAALELYDCLVVDLRVSKKTNTIHKASAHWIARFSGLSINDAELAYEELQQHGLIIDYENRIGVIRADNYPYDTQVCKKACHISHMLETFPELLREANASETGAFIFKKQEYIIQLFKDTPFWFYDMALAIMEYVTAFENRKWYTSKKSAKNDCDERFGDLNGAVEKYLSRFPSMPEKNDWEKYIIEMFSPKCEPSINGAVNRFYARIQSGDILPIHATPLPVVVPEVESNALQKFTEMSNRIDGLAKIEAAEIFAEYMEVSKKILSYAQKHPDQTQRICGGSPYEVLQNEVYSYLEEWEYYDKATKQKVANLMRDVAVPCLKNHLNNIVIPHIARAKASVKVMEEMFAS